MLLGNSVNGQRSALRLLLIATLQIQEEWSEQELSFSLVSFLPMIHG